MATGVRTLRVLAAIVMPALLPATASAQNAAPPGTGDAPAAKPAPARRSHARTAHAHAAGPVATLPGFEMLVDGGSRLFVELTQSVTVEEKKAPHRVTYILKGAHVVKRNNENALVTVHFNTPVARARLIPSGGDLHFIVDLRADATPTFKIEAGKDNSAILEIDFPKGDFVKGPPAPPPDPTGPDGTDNSENSDKSDKSDDNGGSSGKPAAKPAPSGY